jgi:hypothetical protein
MRWDLLAVAVAISLITPPLIVLAQVSDIVPPQPKAPTGRCDTALPAITAPVCCLVAIDISVEGKAVESRATCSDPAFESPVAVCRRAETFVPARQGGKPIPFTVRMRVLLGEERGNAANLCQPLFANAPG